LNTLLQVSKLVLMWVGTVIFFIVGAWMLYEAFTMEQDSGSGLQEAHEELEKEGLVEAEGAVKDSEKADKLSHPAAAAGKEKLGFWAVVLKAFVLNSVAEFGDRTQIAIVVLCADYSPFFIAAGALFAFLFVTAGAVFLGHYLSDKIQERYITMMAGGLFVIFGFLSLADILLGH